MIALERACQSDERDEAAHDFGHMLRLFGPKGRASRVGGHEVAGEA